MKTLHILAGVVLALGLAIPGLTQTALAGSPGEASQTAEQTQSFAVEKMSCAACPITVKKAMQRVDGVKTVKVDFESKTAVVVFDPSVTDAEKIAAASTDVGYPATAINTQ